MSDDRLSDQEARGSEGAEIGEAAPPPSEEDGCPGATTASLVSIVPVAPPATAPLAAAPARAGWLSTRRSRIGLWWRGASPNLRGSVYMLSALLVYAVMVGLFKHLGSAIPLVETLMIRQLIMSLVILAVVGRALPSMLRTRHPGLQIFRGVVTLASMLCGFSALIHIPLAQATSISFSQVLFVTIAAVLVLKEKVDSRRWAATIIGFAGILIMLNPTTEGLNFWALMAVGLTASSVMSPSKTSRLASPFKIILFAAKLKLP